MVDPPLLMIRLKHLPILYLVAPVGRIGDRREPFKSRRVRNERL